MVVGLGNPGPEFEGTRHNLGAEVVRTLESRHGEGSLRAEKGLADLVAAVQVGDRRVVLAVPTTYMNESGAAVRPLLKRFGLADTWHLVVAHDELDLPPGGFRIKAGGGTAGHRGLESVRAHLHTTDFVRVRLGIGRPPHRQAGADYVLKRPSKAERGQLDLCVTAAADAVETIVIDGVEAAMNRHHGAS
ncbi:MAG: aminoacyl-tRNA hydrolase [Acidimicrobiales bacterium]